MKQIIFALLLSLLPVAANAEDTAPAAAAAAPQPAVREWKMVEKESSISFKGKQMGKDFDGEIRNFTSAIYFDDAHLDQSKVTADIDLTTIDARDTDRNKSLFSADWLDIPQFPKARFETQKILKKDDGSYVAEATLTLHGTVQQIELPFTLAIDTKDSGKDTAVMNGKVTLDRSKFALGTGDWADPSVIANEIVVDVKVTATSEK
jgi:polyisoprenoid-binding protein YceI